MRTFTDTTGDTWSIDLPFGTVLRIKAESQGKFDLLDPSPLVERLARDELEFWELLWHLVEPQAKARPAAVTAEDFGQRMAADCLHQARQSFFEEWADFFRQLRRPDREAAVAKMAQFLAKAIELTQAKINGPEMQQLEQQLTAQLESHLNSSFGELQASLESTPAASPGGN